MCQLSAKHNTFPATIYNTEEFVQCISVKKDVINTLRESIYNTEIFI